MVASKPVILLPPSEGKASGGDGRAWKRGSMAVDLDTERLEVIAALGRAMKGSAAARAALLGVKGTALSAATAADKQIAASPTMPAILRYTGVLYDALDYGSLSPAQRKRLDASVLIFSGLWGLVAPRDAIPDYKLKMGAKLGKLGRLSTWWREPLSERLASVARRRTVWNLLPNEHAAAWQAPEGIEQYTVTFLERRASDGVMVAVSHRNKSLKGAFLRMLTAKASTAPSDLKTWRLPGGFRYSPKLDDQVRPGIVTLSFLQTGA